MQTHRRFVRAFPQIVTALCAVGLAYGQGFGTIVGTVTDPAGAVIPGAKIKITDDATAISGETSANDQGYYVVPSLRPSTYDRGPSEFDHQRRFVMVYLYDLPKLAGAGAMLRTALGGWQLTGILSY